MRQEGIHIIGVGEVPAGAVEDIPKGSGDGWIRDLVLRGH